MPMSVNIPTDVWPFLKQAVASGAYQNEQEAVSAILRVAAGSLEGYQQIKNGVAKSLEDEREGKVQEADFDQIRRQIADQSDS
jgi:Arc/MetJ-type ribon-helix-helix transcriptional regulator